MTHKHHYLAFWYHEGCPACKVRQLRYSFRLDPTGLETEIEKIKWGRAFDAAERKWILKQVGY